MNGYEDDEALRFDFGGLARGRGGAAGDAREATDDDGFGGGSFEDDGFSDGDSADGDSADGDVADGDVAGDRFTGDGLAEDGYADDGFGRPAAWTTGVAPQLNPEQREAVEHEDGPLMILAGPGSGKTRVITQRILRLMERGVSPRHVAAMTFTNKAASEMRSRLLAAEPRAAGVWMGTFHRFCSMLLRQHGSHVGLSENFSIYDTEDSRRLMTAVLHDLELKTRYSTPASIAHRIGKLKNELVRAEEFEPRRGNPLDVTVQAVYPEYQRRLLAANAADFDDLLMHVALMLQDNPELRERLDSRFRYLLVDEYQDTNTAQFAIVRLLSVDFPNVTVTGDPDQSIYSWRGANIRNTLEFERRFPETVVVRLEQNYRSTPQILRVADALIQRNERRKAKLLRTENAAGAPVRLSCYPDAEYEARRIAAHIANAVASGTRRASDFAVFYRINALSRSFEQAFRAMGVPFQVVRGQEFFARKEVKDVLAYLHLVNNPANDVALLRVINTPPRGLGAMTVRRLQSMAAAHRVTLIEAVRRAGPDDGFSTRALKSLAGFRSILEDLDRLATSALPAILEEVLARTGYSAWLADSGTNEDLERQANVNELVTAADEFTSRYPEETEQLEAFLEEVSLIADTDAIDDNVDRVSLMTLHAAKGLEFPVVFFTAIEEGMLPHERSLSEDDPTDGIEEERRLMFVGMTRAMEELHLSYCDSRRFRGRAYRAVPSSFLLELPQEELEIIRPEVPEPVESVDRQPLDSEYVDEGPSPPPAPSSDAPSASPGIPRLQTAAEMAGEGLGTTEAIDPDAVQAGMMVEHPEYGLGRVSMAEGKGPRCTVTVSFFAPAREKRFRVAYSPLRLPASGSND